MTDYHQSTRHLVMPQHLNAANTLFGGQLLAWIDEGAALYAACQMKTDHLVTLKFAETIFKVPVEQGRVVTIYCKTVKEGSTSLTVSVLVTKKSYEQGQEEIVIETELVFVAVDECGKKKIWRKK